MNGIFILFKVKIAYVYKKYVGIAPLDLHFCFYSVCYCASGVFIVFNLVFQLNSDIPSVSGIFGVTGVLSIMSLLSLVSPCSVNVSEEHIANNDNSPNTQKPVLMV